MKTRAVRMYGTRDFRPEEKDMMMFLFIYRTGPLQKWATVCWHLTDV